MNKKEVSEIKKQFTPANCAITRICGCYVDHEKNKKMESKEAFLSLPEEEAFKYFEIFKKTLSGKIGKNILNLSFPLSSEKPGGPQDFLLELRKSRLEDKELIEKFYDKVIENYNFESNYYIILIHGMYDIPGKTSDGETMYDASEDVYEYILCSICPVSLSKPGLGYYAENNKIQDLIREWVVDKPDKGFLFPAFNDRNADIHNVLYYTKKTNDIQEDMIENLLGAMLPMSADVQKELFQRMIEDVLDEQSDCNTVKNIHETINEIIVEHEKDPDPLLFDKKDIRKIFEKSGVTDICMEEFDSVYELMVPQKRLFAANNITDTSKLHIKSCDIELKIENESLHKVRTALVEGRKCLVIQTDDEIEVNGSIVKTLITNN